VGREPLPEFYENATGMTEPTADLHGGPTSSLEDLLVNGLGATIHRDTESEGEAR
jgi:hypothetical protein